MPQLTLLAPVSFKPRIPRIDQIINRQSQIENEDGGVPVLRSSSATEGGSVLASRLAPSSVFCHLPFPASTSLRGSLGQGAAQRQMIQFTGMKLLQL
jgi:hypothetical protein